MVLESSWTGYAAVEAIDESYCLLAGGGGGGGAVGGAAKDVRRPPPGGAQKSSRRIGVSCCYAIGSFLSKGGAGGGLCPPSWW